MKIDFPTLMDIQQEIDPELHREVFVKTANDLVIRGVPKVNTKLKRRWNLVMKKKNPSSYVVASAVDHTFSNRTGTLKINSAKTDRPLIEIIMSGSPIHDSRFDFSFAKEIDFFKSNKAKHAAAIKRRDRSIKKDKYALKRPRVKILKSKNATMLQTAFYAKMKSGHEGIFRRNKNDKVVEMKTITLPSMFEQLDFNAILSDHFVKNVTKRYDHYLYRELRKRGVR